MHVINDLSVGGAEMMLYKLLSGADSQHFSPAVISLGRRSVLDERIEALGVPVHNLGLKPSTLQSRMKKLGIGAAG